MSDMNRRTLLSGAAAGLGVAFRRPSQAARIEHAGTKALAFDAFPILDPRPVFGLCEHLYPQRGAELANLWRARQFEYQWLRALSAHYVDFEKATEDALVFATNSLKLPLMPEQRQRLMGAYLELKAWPDVATALQTLRKRGIRLAFLSNATPRILFAGIKNSKLERMFEHVLSTDTIKTYKPDPRAYQLAVDALMAHNPINTRPSSGSEGPSVLPNFATTVALRAGVFTTTALSRLESQVFTTWIHPST